jgi:hypothetical protein
MGSGLRTGQVGFPTIAVEALLHYPRVKLDKRNMINKFILAPQGVPCPDQDELRAGMEYARSKKV